MATKNATTIRRTRAATRDDWKNTDWVKIAQEQARGAAVAASYIENLTFATSCDSLKVEMDALSRNELIGFGSLVQKLLLDARRINDVTALAERESAHGLKVAAEAMRSPD